MKTVLVTGASGFIGRQTIAPLLERGFAVHTVSSRPATTIHADVQHHHCDLLDVRQSERLVNRIKPSHLLHFAWCAAPGAYRTSPENLRWLQASLGLVESFRRNGGQRAVIAGSSAEYDWRFGVLTEGVTPSAPSSLYGACKYSLAIALASYAQEVGLSLASGRIFFVYGPNEHPSRLLASVIRSLITGREALCTAGTQVRDFQHVQDTAGAFVALLESPVVGVVNIATGLGLTVTEIVSKVAQRLDANHLIRMGALDTPANEPPAVVAVVRRLRDEVGWTDRFDIDRGIDDSIRWWRSRIASEPS